MITEHQKQALLLEVHRAIEEAAVEGAKKIASPREFAVAYPPNGSLSEEESAALEDLELNSVLNSALRKIMADAASYPVFRLFSLLDGVAEPFDYEDSWTGFTLHPVEKEHDDVSGSYLHDDLFGTYWDWRKTRIDPGWRLDNLEESDL